MPSDLINLLNADKMIAQIDTQFFGEFFALLCVVIGCIIAVMLIVSPLIIMVRLGRIIKLLESIADNSQR